MSNQHQFSDEEITAYLDGEADGELIRSIDAALPTDANLQGRINALSIPIRDIQSAFDGMLKASPDFPSNLSANSNRPQASSEGWRNRLMPIAASIAVCFMAGWIAAGYFNRVAENDWHNSVATYQMLYVDATLAHVNQSPLVAQEELTRAAAALGKTISLEAMNGSADLVYKRAQILGLNGRPLIQLAFMSKNGDPVALCIIKNNTPRDTMVAFRELNGMKSASWSKGEFDYLLIGGSDAALIDENAGLLAARL
jgi:anti-sigma factor RsiW